MRDKGCVVRHDLFATPNVSTTLTHALPPGELLRLEGNELNVDISRATLMEARLQREGGEVSISCSTFTEGGGTHSPVWRRRYGCVLAEAGLPQLASAGFWNASLVIPERGRGRASC